MTPIPTFLTAIADLCDKHGTHAKHMGPELRLLAGLPWERAPKATREGISHFPGVDWTDFVEEEHELAPCDIARGWLFCARVREPGTRGGFEATPEAEMDRAAACAELAVLSARLYLQPSDHPEYMGAVLAHDGTPEGGRAAWSFMVEQLEQGKPAIDVVPAAHAQADLAQSMGEALLDAHWDRFVGLYRRELEEMK